MKREPKRVHVQAKVGGNLIFDKQVEHKKNGPKLIREGLAAIAATGQTGRLRSQTVGASGWAVYELEAGAKMAQFIPRGEF